MMVSDRLPLDRSALVQFCTRYKIQRLSFFGSVLRDDFGPDSDVDVLLEFQPDAQIGLFEIIRMEIEFADLLHTNQKIDIRTPADLSRYFRQHVLDSAETQYVAA